MTALTQTEQARLALDAATWEVNFWARIIAEIPARVTDNAVVYIATPETHRRYAEAVAAEAEARDVWLATQEVSA